MIRSYSWLASLVICFAAGRGLHAQTREFVADPSPTASSHASTIIELPGGDLLAAWFGGTREGAADVAVWSARRDNVRWAEAKELVREPHIAVFNPVLFQPIPGLLWLYYKFGPAPSGWSAGRMVSRNEGRTWTAPEHLPAGLYGPIRTKPLVLADGVILRGTSVESYGSWACWIERSVDHGVSWQRIGPIAAPPEIASTAPSTGSSFGIIQPSLIWMGGTHIRLYARSTREIGRICQSDSFNGGLAWSKVKVTELPNPNSGIDVVRLHTGALVIVYNRSTEERTPLNLAISQDGLHWRDFFTLDAGPGEYSYPALIEARNGDLLITYTWRREKIRFVRFPRNRIP